MGVGLTMPRVGMALNWRENKPEIRHSVGTDYCPDQNSPFRHIPGLFDATDEEQAALLALVREAKTLLDGRFHPDGYNVGVNVGAAAGQTVMHLHVHVIPRYAGDVEDPRGGVRGAIPEKRRY